MTYDAAGIKSLFRLTFQAPRAAARRLIDDPPPRQAVWLVIWLQAVLMTGLMIALAMAGSGALPPVGPLPMLAMPVAVVVSVLLSTLVLSEAGRIFGGKGSFWDVLLTSVWLSVVNMVLTLVQIALTLMVPQLAGLVQIGLFLLLLWIAVAMLQEVHRFGSPWPAIGAYVLAIVMMAGLILVLSVAAVRLGGMA